MIQLDFQSQIKNPTDSLRHWLRNPGWWAAKSINFILKFNIYVTTRKSDFLTNYLSTCLSWSSVLMQCCTLTWVMKILMQAISNFPIPALVEFSIFAHGRLSTKFPCMWWFCVHIVIIFHTLASGCFQGFSGKNT